MTFIKRRTFAAVLMGGILLLSSLPHIARADAPEDAVEGFHSGLTGIMKEGKKIGISGRYNKFLKLSDKYFHIPLMVAFVSGENWTKADKEARMHLIQAARRMGAGELAVLFSGYGGETFSTLGAHGIKDGSVLVETELVRKAESNVKLTYRLRKFGNEWRIIDVLLDGAISQLLKRRDEYRRTLEQSGIDGLTALLNAKADEILASEAVGDKAAK